MLLHYYGLNITNRFVHEVLSKRQWKMKSYENSEPQLIESGPCMFI